MPKVKSPLRPRTLWRRNVAEGSIEKVVISPEAYSDMPMYVLIPEGLAPPYRWMICLQGHGTGIHRSIGLEENELTQLDSSDNDLDFGLQCLRRGFAALCPEMRGFGQRREFILKTDSSKGCATAAMHALMLGRTLIGERVFDIDCALDYLAGRNDVDMRRIGIMGHSGGGTVTVFAAALLKRISLAAPVSYFGSFESSIMAMRHCMCNYLPGLLQYAEMSDIMGLFAPRPVIVVSGDTDPIFPISGVRKGLRQLKKIYSAAGSPGNCRLVVGSGGHRAFAEPTWAEIEKLTARIWG